VRPARGFFLGEFVQRKSFSLLPLLVVGLVWSVSGCRSAPPSVETVGSARFVSHVEQTVVSTGVARVSVALSIPDEDFSRILELDNVSGEWTGTMEGIPAGDHRVFTAEAFGSDGTKLFAGRAMGVTITAGRTALVSILLQQLSPPPPFENAVPIIDSLVASASAVAPGGTLTLKASAHDPNAGDSLTYAWTGAEGTFGSPSSATTAWTAPSAEGRVPLTVTVTDSHGAVAAMTVTIPVRAPSSGSGGADIDISLNTWPRVARITASPSRVKPGEPTTVEVSASDVDGDTLTYHWSASGCTGSWVDTGSASARFTPDAVPATGACGCRLDVTVRDGRGGQGQGTLAICVGETPSATFPPVVVAASRSSDSATPGGTLTLRVEAEDPQGSALGFAWAASTGTLGKPVDSASASEVLWTAPTCVLPKSATPAITAMVRNALGLSTSYTFTFGGLPECGSWSTAGALTWNRAAFTLTLLPSGQVLAAGGRDLSDTGIDTAELYEPVTRSWSVTGPLSGARYAHTATLLPSGKVLVTGGTATASRIPLATVELYDPASGTWSAAPPMGTARAAHTATLLPSGKVLVVGGNGLDQMATAELYDPATDTWSPAGLPLDYRNGHTATLLPSGKVLVVGGAGGGRIRLTAELYDPGSDTWSLAASPESFRIDHTATLLPSGLVLVVGGPTVQVAELYDPAADRWSRAANHRLRLGHTATLLPSGLVLVVGGQSLDGLSTPEMRADLYHPGPNLWEVLRDLDSPRQYHQAVLLPTGQVLVAGGSLGVTTAAVLYTP
jgi:hypothetical protein